MSINFQRTGSPVYVTEADLAAGVDFPVGTLVVTELGRLHYKSEEGISGWAHDTGATGPQGAPGTIDEATLSTIFDRLDRMRVALLFLGIDVDDPIFNG